MSYLVYFSGNVFQGQQHACLLQFGERSHDQPVPKGAWWPQEIDVSNFFPPYGDSKPVRFRKISMIYYYRGPLICNLS